VWLRGHGKSWNRTRVAYLAHAARVVRRLQRALAMRIACLIALATVSLGAGCTSSPFDGDWQVTRTVSSQSNGCDPVKARAIDISVDSTRDRPVSGSDVMSWGDNDIVDGELVFATQESAYADDGDSIVLGYHLKLDGDALTGVVLAEGDQGPNVGCLYAFDARAARTR
jgi:hypothetical protein